MLFIADWSNVFRVQGMSHWHI